MAHDLDDLASRLRDIAEELADLALRELHDAVEAGRTERPEAERRLTRARRAVEKAVAVLEATDRRTDEHD
ncbi:MAG: hypothetical protein MUF83_02825 [Acidimicrobiales bacterium]|jgi:HEPN domain-containing protein|nr:hypothetical protein [Acidimicrobiales bacterium]